MHRQRFICVNLDRCDAAAAPMVNTQPVECPECDAPLVSERSGGMETKVVADIYIMVCLSVGIIFFGLCWRTGVLPLMFNAGGIALGRTIESGSVIKDPFNRGSQMDYQFISSSSQSGRACSLDNPNNLLTKGYLTNSDIAKLLHLAYSIDHTDIMSYPRPQAKDVFDDARIKDISNMMTVDVLPLMLIEQYYTGGKLVSSLAAAKHTMAKDINLVDQHILSY